MKKILLFPFIVILVSSCAKQEIRFEDLVDVRFMADSVIIADGTDAIRTRVTFNKDAVISKINAKATISNGKFLESDSDELTISPIRDLNDRVFKDSILAEFFIQGTTIRRNHRLTIVVNEFEEIFTIQSIKSEPSSIKLALSSSSVFPNFTDELTITGKLSNENGRKVSQGAKVVVSVLFENGLDAGGIFREERFSSNDASEVSVKYSPGLIESNQFLNIVMDVVDDNGSPLGISDSIMVFIKEIE